MNVALIGCGTLGSIHAQVAGLCGLKVVVCADVVGKKAKALANVTGAEPTTDCMGALGRGDVDIVAIATPTPKHSMYVVAAAEAGKHVFCEKPFGRTLDQCRDALAAVKKAKVKLHVGHVVRYFTGFDAMKAQVDAGAIGKVGFVKCFRGGGFPRGEADWFRDFEQSGGTALDLIIHDFDWLRYVFGDVETVFGQDIHEKMPDLIDHSQATLRMNNGIIAQVIGSWAHPQGFYATTEICGDGGMIKFSTQDSPTTFMKRQPAGAGPGVIVPSSPQEKSPFQLEWEDFLANIAGEREPRVTGEDAMEAVRVSLAVLESAETGKPVKLASARKR